MEDSVEPDPGSWGDELDRVTAALADKHRRYVIHHLAVDGGHATVDELADGLAEWGSRDRSTVETALVHRHFPKLSEVGLIVVDRDAGVVRLSEKGRRVDDVRSTCVEAARATCG